MLRPTFALTIVTAAIGLLVLPVLPGAAADGAEETRPNVLFIAIDDLNDWVGHLGGHSDVRTPHLDRLPRRGISFSNAHCVAPACNPSRAALLSGLRPSTSGIYHNQHDWANTLADLCGLPVPEHIQGVSLRPLLTDPDATWDRMALTTHGRGEHGVRCERWRYIRYHDGTEELYDHADDPMEWHNLAGQPQQDGRKKEMAQWMPETEVPNAPVAERYKKRARKK